MREEYALYLAGSALYLAGSALQKWVPSVETQETLNEVEVGELQRLFAETLTEAVDQAAHHSAVAVMNDVVHNAKQLQTPEGRTNLDLVAAAEGRRVDSLLNLLREIDRMCLTVCHSVNEMLDTDLDDEVAERLRHLRSAMVTNEEVIRRNIDFNERRWG